MKITIKNIPNELIEDYKNNLKTHLDIANEIGVSDSTISRIFRKENIIVNYKNPEVLRKEYHENKLSIGEIAKKFNCLTETVKKYLIKFNIIDLSTESIRAKKSIYYLNKFDSIKDAESAYWLGFLYADSYVAAKKGENRLILGLQRSDEKHVKAFANFIGENIDVCQTEWYDDRTNKTYLKSLVRVYNKQICEQLIDLGMVSGNKEKYEIPKIPKDFIKDFIRGYFDGDGTIYISQKQNRTQFGICSCNENVLNFIKINIEEYLNIDSIKIYQVDKLYKFSITDRKLIILIMFWLYSDCNIYLKRKFDIFFEIYKNVISSDDYKRYSLISAEMQRVGEKLPDPSRNY